jgi:hypothetical protein
MNRTQIMVHAGGQRITKDVLDMIPLPDQTNTYVPVSHYQLAETLKTVSDDLLKGFTFMSDDYVIAKKGNQFFGLLKYGGEHPEMGLSIAFRNAYDKSMAVGIAIGNSVFICDNLALTGTITIMRKHTQNVWKDLESSIVSAIYNSKNNYYKILDDSATYKTIQVHDDDAFRIYGLLYGRDILSIRQLATARESWDNPAYDDFKDKNLWSLYNHCTDALKTAPPMVRMDKHIELHSFFNAYMDK